MMRTLLLIVLVMIIGIIIGAAFWVEISLWQECRTAHSWFYCLRVLEPR